MFRTIGGVLALLVLTLAVGCSKKSAKNTGGADFSPDSTPAPSSGTPKPGGPKKDSTDKPTWLDAKPEGGKLPVNPTDGEGPWVQKPPEVGNAKLPPAPAGTGVGQPGAPAGQPQPPAPRPPAGTPPTTGGSGKMVTKADMNEVWVFVENFSQGNGGKMPTPDWIIGALVKEKAAAAELVKSGDIILTGSTKRESVWAFERKAPTKGGWIASQNGPEEVSAQEFARRIKE
jgi:hypothetical protein